MREGSPGVESAYHRSEKLGEQLEFQKSVINQAGRCASTSQTKEWAYFRIDASPEEISTYAGPSQVAPGGRLVGIVVPRVSKTPLTPKAETLDEETIHGILANNLLEPSSSRSRLAWSRMVLQSIRGDDEDDALLE